MNTEKSHAEDQDQLQPLETLLGGIRRAGSFFAAGSLELPMPCVEVEGVGVLSFPVPPEQIRRLIEKAERAPFGRGEKTIVDETVRKVWQLPAEEVWIGGKSWPQNFEALLAKVARGLGCEPAGVSAELYKFLVYDQGAFFVAHRDTEKAPGMFGTLVVVLPSRHRGGELIIRHAGNEACVDMSQGGGSELSYAGFYTDCEHEVRPIEEGNRICLVYNLIQKGRKKPFTPPDFAPEISAAARILQKAFHAKDAPAKIGYLLEHQYSPAGLSFEGLKSADLARTQTLAAAAKIAGCAIHLGIVHLEESGPAEIQYSDNYWGEEEDEEDEEFEVVEVSCSESWIDQWRDLDDRPVEFGRIPLEEEELLPIDGLKKIKPDEQRVHEATGNEGASFERSYHCAAVILWPRERGIQVLLQAGVGAVIPVLKKQVEEAESVSARKEACATAALLIDRWKSTAIPGWYPGKTEQPIRIEMLQVLVQLGEPSLIEEFVKTIVTMRYNGSENEALVAVAERLGPLKGTRLLAALIETILPRAHAACATLLDRLIEAGRPAGKWVPGLKKMAGILVSGLDKISKPARSKTDSPADPEETAQAEFVSSLLSALGRLNAGTMCAVAAAAFAEKPSVFDPAKVVTPALVALHRIRGNAMPGFLYLWRHTAEFLLARSEQPPAPPGDWHQDVHIRCKCADCRQLQAFAQDPAAQIYRFRVRQELRRHLHDTINSMGLDMTHVTERTGSPQTLVCTKTRGAYERLCAQYRADIACFEALVPLVEGGGESAIRLRMLAAIERSGEAAAG